MKKIINILIVLTALITLTACGSKGPRLSEIAEKFNNNEDIKSYKEMGYTYEAIANGNKITLKSNGENVPKVELELTLKNDILSGSFDLKDDDKAISSIFMINNLISVIEEFNGYKNGELNKSLTDERITKYTLEKEGLEYKLDDKNHLDIKIDITKKIPLLDFSNIYIKTEDLEDLKEYIKEGSINTSAGNVILKMDNIDNETIIYIAEQDKLTKNSYNSLKSILEVLFESKKAVDYLESNYKSIEEGNKDFKGVKIEVNINLEDDEMTLPDNTYKVMKVTLDKKLVKKQLNKN